VRRTLAAGLILCLATRVSAQSGADGPLLAGVNSENTTLGVSPLSGFTARISGVGLEGFSAVEGISFDSASGVLYGIDTSTHELVSIDWNARQGTPIGGTGALGLGSIAYDPARRLLYAVQIVGGAPDLLLTIDPATGASTVIGSTGIADVGGLAYDAAAGILYATDIGTADTLIRLNKNTGQATTIGPLGFVFVGALAVDGATGTLYGVDLQGDRLITINKANGHGTALSSTLGSGGFTNVRGLAVDPFSGTLVGMDAATKQLLRIDKGTGAGTALGSLGTSDLRGMAYDPLGNALFATTTRNDKLIAIDLVLGHANPIGDLTSTSGARLFEVFGITYDPYRGKLLGADRLSRKLVTLNRNTGHATSEVDLRYPDGQPVRGMRALGFDTRSRTVYGVDSDGISSRFVRIDWTTGATVEVNPSRPITFPNVDGLAFIVQGGFFVASVDNAVPADPFHGLIVILPGTGQWFEAFDLEVGRMYGLVYDPYSASLGGTTGGQFYRVLSGGQGTAVGTLGAPDVEGLALDPQSGVLYGTTVGSLSNPAGRLISIQPSTGQGTPVGELVDVSDNHYTAVAGLAFDPSAGVLYGSDTLRDVLVRIDRSTARVTPIGPLGFGDVQGLAFHPGVNVLYGFDSVTGQLLRINPNTGAGTAIGPVGFAGIQGLGVDVFSGELYGTDTRTLELVRINRASGAGTRVGRTPYKVDGLAGRIQ